MRRVVFLPGAIGALSRWQAVGARLPVAWAKAYLAWPGLGDQPASSDVNGLDDLVALAVSELDKTSDLVAQSMGAVIALRVAAEHPARVRRLALVAIAGSVEVEALGGADWRADYRRAYPWAAAWITDEAPHFTEAIARIAAPTLVISGESDPISPVVVGERLCALMPDATLRVIAGGTHDMVDEHADELARLIEAHLRAA